MTTHLIETEHGFYSSEEVGYSIDDCIPHGTIVPFTSGISKESLVVYSNNSSRYTLVPTADLSHIDPLLDATKSANKRRNIRRYITFLKPILAKIRMEKARLMVEKDRLHELDLFSVFNETDLVKYLRFIEEKPKRN
jgi:hypothetical protein